MLSHFRVVDLTNERGLLCGQILSDLGADVIAVEPPGGNSARAIGPFKDDQVHRENSLFWWAYSRNKRSIVLDPLNSTDRSTLLQLIESADVLIESAMPGEMAELELDCQTIAEINPGLVYVSITPFGQTGPKSGYAESDLVVLSAGYSLWAGDINRSPLRIVAPQAYLHAGADAAVATLIALFARKKSGLGQQVDISAQQSVAINNQSMILAASIGEAEMERVSEGVKLGAVTYRLIWPALDGYTGAIVLLGPAQQGFSGGMMQWLFDEGFCDEYIRDLDFTIQPETEDDLGDYNRAIELLASLFKTKTKIELLDIAMERKLLIAPVLTTKDLLESEQLQSRMFWQKHQITGHSRPVSYPGAFAKFSRTPLGNGRPAPAMNEHASEILNDLLARGVTIKKVVHNAIETDQPLKGIRILDFTWVMAGPAATRVLADYGAEVIRVESSKRLDTMRFFPPNHQGVPGPENSGVYQNLNAGKRNLTVDLSGTQGKTIIRDLVQWADVVTESFSPKGMKGFGFDYENLCKIKPDLIMLSSCLFGQTGPLAMFAGFGNLAAALGGFNSLTGWPDQQPVPVGAYTDYISPRYTTISILAALENRNRTGEGQYIDISQLEASLHFLTPAILDYAVNDRIMGLSGNFDSDLAPHGFYPAGGEDSWLAMAIKGDDQFRKLCELMKHKDLADHSSYKTHTLRRENRVDLDVIIGKWTVHYRLEDLEAILQEAGIAAHGAANSQAALNDPQLQHRNHFLKLPHPLHGATTVENSRFILSRTPASVTRCAPMLGQDNDYILSELLGYDENKITELKEMKVLI